MKNQVRVLQRNLQFKFLPVLVRSTLIGFKFKQWIRLLKISVGINCNKDLLQRIRILVCKNIVTSLSTLLSVRVTVASVWMSVASVWVSVVSMWVSVCCLVVRGRRGRVGLVVGRDVVAVAAWNKIWYQRDAWRIGQVIFKHFWTPWVPNLGFPYLRL